MGDEGGDGLLDPEEEYSVVDIKEGNGLSEVRTEEDVVRLCEIAFRHLYPGREYNYRVTAEFSGKFSPYNGNVSRRNDALHFGLSRKWIGISPEILQGLIEELMLKILGGKNPGSMYIDLYNNFIKRLHIAIPKTESHPLLEESFNRVNERYFIGQIERPNLRFGTASRRRLGTYDYRTDTITISTIFESHPDAIDYIMYHELLHKALKFRSSGSKNFHHTSQFRTMERVFEGQAAMEEKLKRIIASSRRRQKQPPTDSLVKQLTRFFQ